jgi:hypothetical protein
LLGGFQHQVEVNIDKDVFRNLLAKEPVPRLPADQDPQKVRLARVAQTNDSAAVTVGNPLQYVYSIVLT